MKINASVDESRTPNPKTYLQIFDLPEMMPKKPHANGTQCQPRKIIMRMQLNHVKTTVLEYKVYSRLTN